MAETTAADAASYHVDIPDDIADRYETRRTYSKQIQLKKGRYRHYRRRREENHDLRSLQKCVLILSLFLLTTPIIFICCYIQLFKEAKNRVFNCNNLFNLQESTDINHLESKVNELERKMTRLNTNKAYQVELKSKLPDVLHNVTIEHVKAKTKLDECQKIILQQREEADSLIENQYIRNYYILIIFYILMFLLINCGSYLYLHRFRQLHTKKWMKVFFILSIIAHVMVIVYLNKTHPMEFIHSSEFSEEKYGRLGLDFSTAGRPGRGYSFFPSYKSGHRPGGRIFSAARPGR